MALKIKISPSVYEALPADVKKEYKQSGSDYVLDLDGYEDPVELRNARDREKEAAATAKRERDAEKRRADEAERKAKDLEDAGKSVDEAVKTKEKEMQAKYDKDIGERDTKLSGLTTAVTNSHREALAKTLANKISTSPNLLVPHLLNRIKVEIDPQSNQPKHTITDADGKDSAWTVDDLEKDVLKNKEFAPILRGTKATGGGGAPPGPGGGGAPRQQSSHRPGTPQNDLTKMDASEFAANIRASKEAGA